MLWQLEHLYPDILLILKHLFPDNILLLLWQLEHLYPDIILISMWIEILEAEFKGLNQKQ